MPPAKILDGKTLASKILDRLRSRVTAMPSQLGLAVILVGDNPASIAYIRQKQKIAEVAGINFQKINYPETATTEELLLEIAKLNQAESVHGIIVQLPLPQHVDKAQILPAIDPAKDVDGFHPLNYGRNFVKLPEAILPATPAGILRLLAEYKIKLQGAEIVIVGHSNIVGKPLAMMLINCDATVTVCHEFTGDLASHTQKADILISATGVPHLIKANMVKKGAVVVDVGGVKVKGQLTGDVDFEKVKDQADYITPVPGGVGPMTVAILMENVVACAENKIKNKE